MSFSTNNAAQAYKQAGAAGALGQDPHGLIAMLFEGAIIAIAAARTQMQLGQVQEKCQSISKAISIIEDGLHASLDEKSGGDISGQLTQLYEYMVSRLVEANTSNQADALDEVGGLLSQLASAWAEIKPPTQLEASMEDA